MNMRASFLGLLVTLSCAAQAGAPAPPIAGLWLHHEKWEFAPEEINENGNIHKSALAAVMNFCTDGEFRMATGRMYQSSKSTTVEIGASDGLAVYSGLWWMAGDAIRVEYRLVSAEIRRVPDDLHTGTVHVGMLNRVDGLLRFPFVTRSERTRDMDFMPAARYEKTVVDEFVSCKAR